MTLQNTLDDFKAKFEAGAAPWNVSPSVIEKMQRATAELKATRQADRAKEVGDKAPTFVLKDPEGNDVSSEVLLKKGPLIISFYRGAWCPYCNMELQALQAALPQSGESNVRSAK
jgi:thiol-disulfide isomerase/thioredoxin